MDYYWGTRKKKIKEIMDEIIEFSELGEFIDVPLKNYSSGMKARLGFSIATCIRPDVLIVDEVLAVGDVQFREKCEWHIQKMLKNGTAVLFVSHSLAQIEKLCSRVMWLEKGKIREIGETKLVCEKFKNEKV